ncbi:MAG: aminopeptidase N [Streptosporangiaceae bacterium]
MIQTSSIPNLTREAARTRSRLLRVDSYDLVLDVTDGHGEPSERTFRSTTTIRFATGQLGDETFIDIVADRLRAVTLNGAEVKTAGYAPAWGISLQNLGAENVLIVDADMLYTNSGEGLHRFVDPLDSETYLYSQFETADAKRVYACFDQPDLKATFTFHVTVPEHWEVASNGRIERVEELTDGKTVHFATTASISPYITALVAGPYHVVRSRHDNIDLGLWCRKTLAQHLDSEDLFEVTAQGFDWYQANFGVRYAFDKYDQLFVPEFNAGAMENAGCVTIHEDFVFRGKVTDAQYRRRAMVILHEMAHMWFGDLVTMRWWDDLWLNESFATYVAALCQAGATRWPEAWTVFATAEKTWAYRQDQLPSTHPIATDAPDVQTAEVNFDGITYAKGASVLKQLGAYVGVEQFLAGLRAYFAEHAYGNTTLSDLLHALEDSSGRDLTTWSGLWLETTGISTLHPEFTVDAAGNYASFEVVQAAPNDIALTNTLRPHRLAIGLYDQQGGQLVRTDRVELDVAGERTAAEQLVGRPQRPLVLVNDDDLTYGKLRLDDHSLATLRAGGIAQVADSLPRALCWSAVWDMTRDGELATRDYLALVLAGAEREPDIGMMEALLRQALRALEIYADPAWVPAGYAALADAALVALRRAEPGSDAQLAWTHALLGAARSAEHVATISSLIDGSQLPDGLTVDEELRWKIIQTLSAHGAIGPDVIDAELGRDPSAAGQRYAVTARALQPSPEAKAEAWHLAIYEDSQPNATHEAAVRGFAYATQGELIAPYAERYFADIARVWDNRASELAQKVVAGLFPAWTATICDGTLTMADRFLARKDVPAGLRRLIVEGRADIARAQHARLRDSTAGPDRRTS